MWLVIESLGVGRSRLYIYVGRVPSGKGELVKNSVEDVPGEPYIEGPELGEFI